jgi:hypothetical protein
MSNTKNKVSFGILEDCLRTLRNNSDEGISFKKLAKLVNLLTNRGVPYYSVSGDELEDQWQEISKDIPEEARLLFYPDVKRVSLASNIICCDDKVRLANIRDLIFLSQFGLLERIKTLEKRVTELEKK